MPAGTLRVVWVAAIVIAVLATASILSISPFIQGIAFAPDQGFNWYYWKRPDPTFWSRLSVWGLYGAHQMFWWGLIAWAQRHRDDLKDRTRMHAVNWVALGGTGVFVALHYAQTALFYDGLGQDVAVFASQASVVLLLVVVLVMEAPRRGLFLTRGKGWFRNIRPILVRYHGYYFAWAVTFTYWYHPMEVNAGHLLGFLYMFLLFIQAAFIFTRVHTNRIWTFVLEISVLVHGITVAFVAGQSFWPMFAFGFLFLIVGTQMHGIGLPRRLRWIIAALSVAAMLYVYQDRGWVQLNEVLRIPVIEYGLAFVIAAMLWPWRQRGATPDKV